VIEHPNAHAQPPQPADPAILLLLHFTPVARGRCCGALVTSKVPMTTSFYFVSSLIGACAAVAVGAIYAPVRKHLLWYFGMAVGIATGFTAARYFFLGKHFLLPAMLILGPFGAGIGVLGGAFLESRLKSSTHD